FHRGQDCIQVSGRLSSGALTYIKNHKERRYSSTHRCYYFIWSAERVEELHTGLSVYATVVVEKFSSGVTTLKACVPAEYTEKLERVRYSDATRRTYVSQFRKFLEYIAPASAEEITETHVKKYLAHLVNDKR